MQRQVLYLVDINAGQRAGCMLAAALGDRQIALYDVGGEVFATDNLCTYAYAMLTDGDLQGDVVECPLHGGKFSVRTGAGLGPPIPEDLKTYRVRVVEGVIQVGVSGVFQDGAARTLNRG